MLPYMFDYLNRVLFSYINDPGVSKRKSLLVVMPQSKEVELKLPYVCPGSHITHTTTHHGKTEAMFNYLNRVLFSYINDPGVSK
jgi:hypothetical protein